MTEVKPGDMIEIFYEEFQHWVVYVGDGFVVHVVPVIKTFLTGEAEVKKRQQWDVVENMTWTVNNSLDQKHQQRPAGIIVKDACAQVGHMVPYNVMTSNCEHFVNELRYGKPESRQYELKPGDLIEVDRGAYQHWAVYVGDGFVVHLVPPSEGPGAGSGSMMSVVADRALVKKEKLTAVMGNDKARINNSLDRTYKPLPAELIVKEACALVGKVLPYSITGQNCEHFVNRLRYGKAESRQVQKAGEVLVGIGLVTAFVLVGAFLFRALSGEERNKSKE